MSSLHWRILKKSDLNFDGIWGKEENVIPCEAHRIDLKISIPKNILIQNQ